jgi:hypothetical protein
VTDASATPLFLRARVRPSPIGRPADGISTAHGRDPNGVCTCQSDSGPHRWEYWTGRPRRLSSGHSYATPGSAKAVGYSVVVLARVDEAGR